MVNVAPVEESSSDNEEVPERRPIEEDIDREIEAALSCPCVSDLKEGPCGKQFVVSFSCFLRYNYDNGNQLDKCIDAFNDLQECMVQHPEQFADFVEAKPQNPECSAPSTSQPQQNGGSGGRSL